MTGRANAARIASSAGPGSISTSDVTETRPSSVTEPGWISNCSMALFMAVV